MTKVHAFEGLPGNAVADGTAATTGNTGALSVATGGGTLTFRTAAAAQGTYGIRIISTTTGACRLLMPSESSSLTFQRTTEIRLPTVLPTGANLPTIWTVQGIDGGGVTTTLLRLILDSAGALTLQRNTGALISLGTGFTASYRLRIAVWGVVGTSTTGVLHARVYPYGSATIRTGGTHDSTNSDLGTAPVVQGALGVTAAIAESYQIDYDSDQWGILNAELPELASNTPPTVSVGSDVTLGTSGGTVTLTATASDPDGSIASYAWTVLSMLPAGTNPTITNPTSASASVVITAPGRYVIRCTVTDNGGATATADKKIYVPVGTAARPILDISNAGAWSQQGGATSAAGALADESDTTYTQGPASPASEALERVLLQPQTTPTTWSLDVKHKLNAAGSATCKVRLYECVVNGAGALVSSTQRKEWTLSPTTTAATTNITLTSGEIATVTQWNETMLEFSEL